jgi:hypothetical protein
MGLAQKEAQNPGSAYRLPAGRLHLDIDPPGVNPAGASFWKPTGGPPEVRAGTARRRGSHSRRSARRREWYAKQARQASSIPQPVRSRFALALTGLPRRRPCAGCRFPPNVPGSPAAAADIGGVGDHDKSTISVTSLFTVGCRRGTTGATSAKTKPPRPAGRGGGDCWSQYAAACKMAR